MLIGLYPCILKSTATVKANVVAVQKYFRDHHKAIGLLKELGGIIPQLPNETRWTSQRACYSTFLRNLSIYFEISNKINDMPTNISNLIKNRMLQNEAQIMLTTLDKVTAALNVMQSDSTNIGTAVALWLKLINDLSIPQHVRDSLESRFKGATTAFHLIAYELTKEEEDHELLQEQSEEALEVMRNVHGDNFIPFFAGYTTKDASLFAASIFNSNTKQILAPTKYWQYAAMKSGLPDAKRFCHIMRDIFSCPPSSAGLERVFSSFGLVHDKLRNRLGNERVVKLVKIYCHLRDKNNEKSMADSDEYLAQLNEDNGYDTCK